MAGTTQLTLLPTIFHIIGSGINCDVKNAKHWGTVTSPEANGLDLVLSTCLSRFLSQKSLIAQPADLSKAQLAKTEPYMKGSIKALGDAKAMP